LISDQGIRDIVVFQAGVHDQALVELIGIGAGEVSGEHLCPVWILTGDPSQVRL
jgi:hypothetical protein